MSVYSASLRQAGLTLCIKEMKVALNVTQTSALLT